MSIYLFIVHGILTMLLIQWLILSMELIVLALLYWTSCGVIDTNHALWLVACYLLTQDQDHKRISKGGEERQREREGRGDRERDREKRREREEKKRKREREKGETDSKILLKWQRKSHTCKQLQCILITIKFALCNSTVWNIKMQFQKKRNYKEMIGIEIYYLIHALICTYM